MTNVTTRAWLPVSLCAFALLCVATTSFAQAKEGASVVTNELAGC
jgi:hypothetical protein